MFNGHPPSPPQSTDGDIRPERYLRPPGILQKDQTHETPSNLPAQTEMNVQNHHNSEKSLVSCLVLVSVTCAV